MNAMTGPDYTLYPFATPNSKDFYNLLQVYLDAVFNPLLREMDFLQEGWRLDMDDKKADLAIKGVVFNEMKGAFADAQQVFGQQLLNNLLPSDTYGNCSGGLPEKIPDLTWKNLKQFHSVHYSPNNARFYTYGSLPLDQHLEAVHKYLPPVNPVTAQDVPDVPQVKSSNQFNNLTNLTKPLPYVLSVHVPTSPKPFF
jgi:Zn-dependent M16 (insulinase) family peptidase